MEAIQIRVRIVHTGKEINLSLDPKVTGEAIVKKLLSTQGLNLTKTDNDGNPIVYKLVSKERGCEVNKKGLTDSGIKSGDTLLLNQEVIAG